MTLPHSVSPSVTFNSSSPSPLFPLRSLSLPLCVGWVAKLHHQPCFVVATDYRPVPLQHYLFPAAAQGLFLVVDEKGNFKEDTFQKAMGSLQDQPQDDNKKGKKGSAGAKTQVGSDLFRVVRLIMEKKLDPCIVFSFSKKDCEAYALQMARLDFNDETEKELVGRVFENALESLSQDDRLLPQVLTILPLLKRGIGIHHGGLLPILKEVLEILFQEGLIKCLFATETFSIGINMPAKTVVFTQTRKFDGQDFRWITSGEYIQMSGRAGRRGKDDRGIVIQMIDEKIDPEVAKNMIYGKSDALFSSYHVSYNMVLNMLRVEDADPEILLRSSFHQYQQELHAPELEMKAEELQKEAALIEIQDESLVADYAATQTQFSKTSAEIAATVRQPNHCLPFLEAGRLIQVCFNDTNWGWGVLLSKQKNAGPSSSSFAPGSVLGYSRGDGKKAAADDADFVLDVLMHVEPLNPAIESHQKIMASSEFSRVGGVGPCEEENPSVHEVQVLQISLSVVVGWSAVRLNLPKDMSRDASKKAVQKAIQEVLRRFKADGLPVLNPITDMGIMDENFKVLLSRREELQMRLSGNPFQAAPDHAARLDAFCTRSRLTEEARFCIKQARESQAVAMKDELKRMKKVLRRLGYISPEGVLGTKGRFSCELSTADELVLTDMVFDGVFNELSVDQAVGLLSCFIHKEAQKDGAPPFRADMQASFRQLQTVARAVAKVCIEAKIQIIEEDYVKSFNPGMIDIAVAWSAGAKFAEVCALTDSIFEGSIIRNIRRLEELLRQLASASSAIGNAELKKLFEDGANKIRRGVVFSASLYL